jgi:hypothetical protein
MAAGEEKFAYALALSRQASRLPLWVEVCENAIEPRMHRIVFSIAFFRQKLPVQLVSAST